MRVKDFEELLKSIGEVRAIRVGKRKPRRKMRTFDQHLHGLLETNPKAVLEHGKLFAELPLPTQLVIMRRRWKLAQQARKMHGF